MSLDFKALQLQKKGITIFASGAGTNAENCITYFSFHPFIYVNLIITNNPEAGVIRKAILHQIPHKIYTKEDWKDVNTIIQEIKFYKTDLIVLAGYLALIPFQLIQAFDHQIINIHPALLPKYGGKGMYGKNIHAAVLQNKEIETGISIHFVDAKYDTGSIIFQKKTTLKLSDTIFSIEKKIKKLEFFYLPRVIEKLLK